jgi:TonB family protein
MRKELSKINIGMKTNRIWFIGVIVFLILGYVETNAQCKESEVDTSSLQDSIPVTTNIHSIIDPVETPAQFPGGDKALWEYMKKNILYPSGDICVQGRVILRFVVTPTGDIENIEVKRSLHPDFDKIAVEMVKSMPKWIPGKQNGIPVHSYYILPVTFKLEY